MRGAPARDVENDTDGNSLKLGERERKEVDRRSAIRAHIVHAAIREEGEEI